MKTIEINIKNTEDIIYLDSINYNNNILNTALSIGLKAIQMSQTTMTGNSYYEPLRQIIQENSQENHENISKINDMLCDLMNIKNNSARKGKLGESLATNSLKKKYPHWRIENTTGTAHESDIFAYSEEYGKILYEIKTYNTNVPTKEIQKFKNDMVTTNSKYGIFVSQTSGIVGKRLIDYEIVNDSILIYISCSGLNGHGIELGTEFLLSLINSGCLEKRYLLKDKNVKDILDNINDKMFDLRENINNFSRLKSQINDLRTNMMNGLDLLYKNAMEYEMKGNYTIDLILDEIKVMYPYEVSLIHNSNLLNKFIENIDPLNKANIYKIKDLCTRKNIELYLSKDLIYIVKYSKAIGKINVKKNKLLLYFNIQELEKVELNMKYETIIQNQIYIELLDNEFDENLWQIIDKRLN